MGMDGQRMAAISMQDLDDTSEAASHLSGSKSHRALGKESASANQLQPQQWQSHTEPGVHDIKDAT